MLTRILRNVKGDMFNGRMKGIT